MQFVWIKTEPEFPHLFIGLVGDGVNLPFTLKGNAYRSISDSPVNTYNGNPSQN